MFLIFTIFLFRVNSSLFDTDHPVTVSKTDIGDQGLFGYDFKYSSTSREFYVGAPRAIKDSAIPVENGAVFICPLRSTSGCTQKISPVITRDISSNIILKPLFGYSFLEYARNDLLICGPNLPFTNVNFFCAQYDTSNQLLKESTSFPLKIKNGEKDVLDNYGMQVESLTQTINSETKFIFSKTIKSYSAPPSSGSREIYLISGKAGEVKQDYILENIPGNKYLINYLDTNHYLIVPYPDKSNSFGGFQVFNQNRESVQEISIQDGTIGQQFGFSGSVGKFNNDNLYDVIFTAPFYSKKPDQGIIYLFTLESSNTHFRTSPITLKGDDVEYARFGISVTNIKDRNSDTIDDIAVLASFWYKNNPVLYIYLSTQNGFPQNYFQKISLHGSNTNFNLNLAFKIISDFDVNDDRINELAVTYPLENRFEYSMGLKVINIAASLNYKNFPEDSYIALTSIKPDVDLLMYQMKITLSVVVTDLKTIDATKPPNLRYKISIHGRKHSYFNDDLFPVQLGDQVPITSLNTINIEKNLLFWYSPIPQEKYISIAAEAIVEKNPSCTTGCVTSFKTSVTKNVIPQDLGCEAASCSPNLSITSINYESPLDIGRKNLKTITVVISLTNDLIKSYFQQLIFTYPNSVKVLSISEDLEEASIIITKEIVNSNGTKTHLFTTEYEILTNKPLTLKLELEIIPNIGEESLNILLSTLDPMYGIQTEQYKTITFTLETNPIEISGLSIPNAINILKHEDLAFDKANEILSYKLEIINKQEYSFLPEVFIYLELPLLYQNKKVFDETINFNIDTKTVECKIDMFESCPANAIVYSSENFKPNYITKISISLKDNEFTQLLAINKVNHIEMKLIVKQKINQRTLTLPFSITTIIKSLPSDKSGNLATSISVGGVLGFFLIALIAWLIMKFELTSKLKGKFFNVEADQLY